MGSFLETYNRPNLPWPLSEPVNGTAVDKGGEHTTASTESIPYWTHTQDDMKIITNSADKVVEHSISAKQNRNKNIQYNAKKRWSQNLAKLLRDSSMSEGKQVNTQNKKNIKFHFATVLKTK